MANKKQLPVYGTISADGSRYTLYFSHTPQSNNLTHSHCSALVAFESALPDTPIIDFRPCKDWKEIPIISVNEVDKFAYKGVSFSEFVGLSVKAGASIMPYSKFKALPVK